MAKNISPSKLELISHCAAAFSRTKDLPWEDSDAAKRGRDLHERTALFIKGGIATKDAALDGLISDDAKAVEICVEIANVLRPKEKHFVYLEHTVDLAFLGMPNGTPDLGYYDEGSGWLVVVDWKFGKGFVPDPVTNVQLSAYALGLTRELEKKNLPVNGWLLIVAQPSPRVTDSYRKAKVLPEDFPKWEQDIKKWVAAARVSAPIVTPGPWCRGCFCDAQKKGLCPEFTAYQTAHEEAKAEQKTETAIAQVQGIGFSPISVKFDGFEAVIMDQAAVEKAEGFLAKLSAFPAVIETKAQADALGLVLMEATKFESQVDECRLLAKRPALDFGKKVDDQAAKALLPLKEVKHQAKTRLDDYLRRALLAEQKARQEAEEARRKAEKEKEEAEARAREADRLAAQAKTKAEKEKAARLQAEAKADELKAQAEVKKAEVVVETPSATNVAGVKSGLVTTWEIVDFEAMPGIYKMPDTKMIEAALKSKKITGKEPWIKLSSDIKSSSKGKK